MSASGSFFQQLVLTGNYFPPSFCLFSQGYNAWRDCLKPSELLSKLCRDNSLEDPQFRPGRITVAGRVFTGKTLFMDEGEKAQGTQMSLHHACLHR